MVASLANISVEYFFAITERVSYSLKSQGLTVIGGRNGEGKTTFFIEAIVWLIYGISMEYGVKPGDKVRNRFHKNSAVVEGIIEKGSEQYKVTRTRSKSGGTLFLKRWDGTDWAELEDTTDTLTQDKLVKLWGRDFQTFMNSGMFTSDVLRYPDFSDEQKKAVIDRLLGIDSVSDAYDAVSAELTIANEQKAFEEGTARSYSDNITELKRKLGTEVEARDSFEERVQEKRAELESRKLRQEKIIEACKDTKEGIPAIEADLTVAKDALEALSIKRDPLVAKISKVETSLATLREQLRSKQAILKKEKRLADAGKCPECGASTEQYCSDLRRKETEIAELSKLVDGIVESKTVGDDKLEALDKKLRGAKSNIKTLESNLQTQRDKLETAETRLAECGTDLAETVNKHVGSVTRLEAQIAETEIKLGERAEAAKGFEKTIADLTILKNAFGNRGLRALLVESAIPFIEEHLARVLSVIGFNVEVTLSLSGAGKLEIHVDNPSGAAAYHGSSAGQRRLIDLSILFSFLELQAANQGGISPQILFDEAFEKIDEGWQEAIGRLLRDLVERGASVFLISHSASRIEGMADQVWTVQGGRIYQ